VSQLLAAPPTIGPVHAKRAPVKQFGSFDGLDNRRELYRLLDRLSVGVSPAEGCRRRREFFARCCRALAAKTGQKVEVAPGTVGLVGETYFDVVSLCVMPGYLDIEQVTKALERTVKELGL
jgi:hypothetical protein